MFVVNVNRDFLGLDIGCLAEGCFFTFNYFDNVISGGVADYLIPC